MARDVQGHPELLDALEDELDTSPPPGVGAAPFNRVAFLDEASKLLSALGKFGLPIALAALNAFLASKGLPPIKWPPAGAAPAAGG